MNALAPSHLRARIWGLLALAFHGAEPDLLRDQLVAVLEAARAADSSATFDALERWVQAASAEPRDAIRLDFENLFTVPSGHYVGPYESVHVDEPLSVEGGPARAAIYGPSTRKVEEFYEHVGLRIAHGYKELPDYIGLEAACMEYLFANEASALQREDHKAVDEARQLQESFWTGHMGRWIPSLAMRIRENAATEYHRALAAVLESTC